LGVREVFGVLYSPVKAFNEIVKKPNVKGPILILVLSLLATAATRYVSASKLYLETPTPENDEWTESTIFWTSNGALFNDTDCIVGNYSIESSISNSTSIWMKITSIGQFNCSGDEGYKGLSFRIKWIHQNGTSPSSNATLKLFSSDESHYFKLNLIHDISNSSNEWYNVTDPINVGPESQGWMSSGSPDWENITGLEFRLDWLDAANLTMKIDDLYFGKYKPLLATDLFSPWYISSLMSAATDFFVRWFLYATVLWLFIKLFRAEPGRWSILFIVIGYTFFVMYPIGVVCASVDAFIFSMLPPLSFPLKAWNPIKGEERIASELITKIYEKSWYTTGVYQLSLYIILVFQVWAIVLSAVAIRSLSGFTWKKAMVISGISYILYYLFLRPLIPI